ncbi:hypothetical protein R9X49_11100 [Pectobacterium carotovorum]|uniref:hypothetical protein n=1 Tax=Pectobacterium carotovorum TaxID=554 RepID=UPI0029D68B49|nr:hypothetical protein [Pectobacterium carotovorum]MDX6915653.1 hypothetical protein [Pectobacterium carotovorum]
MAFRADEEAQKGLDYALSKLIPKSGNAEERKAARDVVLELIEELGPVVDSYPSWHPLVSSNNETRYPITTPSKDCGYYGLDHTVYFAKGFVTCPYDGGKEILSSIEHLRGQINYSICARKLETNLYHEQATAIVVSCDLDGYLANDGTIKKSKAIGLLLEKEIPEWRDAQVAETWETMRPYFLGRPHGARSSLFVNQETGQAMKTVWNAIIHTGMYGPIKV